MYSILDSQKNAGIADLSTGHRNSQEPFGFEGGDTNLYRYAHNDPTLAAAPAGRAAAPAPAAAAAAESKAAKVIAAVKMLGDLSFPIRNKGSEQLAKLIGERPDPDVVDILEFNDEIQKLRRDPEVASRIDMALSGVPYNREAIIRYVKSLAGVRGYFDPKDAERELGNLLRSFNQPKVAALVKKILDLDPTIAKLRKDSPKLDEKIKELIKFKGIGDEIPLPGNVG